MSDRSNEEELIGPGNTANAAPTSLGQPAEDDEENAPALGEGTGTTGKTALTDKDWLNTDMS